MFVFKAGVVGARRALEMNLTGEPIDAVETWELGLVSAVVPDHELRGGREAEKASFARVFASQDGREGSAVFVEKRPPRFHGS